MEHFKSLNKGMENKIISLQQRLDEEVRAQRMICKSVEQVRYHIFNPFTPKFEKYVLLTFKEICMREIVRIGSIVTLSSE